MTTGEAGSLGGFVPFPADNLWNTDISGAQIDTNSTNYLNEIGNLGLHPDFGSGLYQGSTIGIPYIVVDGLTSNVNIDYLNSGSPDESDPGPMPIPANAPVEEAGDGHVLVVDKNTCFLYELYQASLNSDNSWTASSGAVWDLLADEQRPYKWTSADAAGLPIFEGLVRYDEVASGTINHAIRFAVNKSINAFVPPASHWAGNSSDTWAAPMGMRLRLHANFDISTFSTANQVILKALKKYGMIAADNGSAMYITGSVDNRWDNNDLHNLQTGVTTNDFDVIKMDTIYTSSNLPTGAKPSISNFTSNLPAVTAGSPVTLSWTETGALYTIISPQVGAVRGTSVTFTPTATATYTIYITNQYGQSTATTMVTVH